LTGAREKREVRAAMVPLPHPVLIADIGGTNCRVALVEAPGAPPVPVTRLSTHDAPSAEAAFAGVLERTGVRPRAAAIAAAGPVMGDAVALTNAGWTLSGPALTRALGLETGLLLNDFEALAAALPGLQASDLAPLAGPAAGRGAQLVLGPGTGFGAAALVGADGRWTLMPSEAGHMALGPASAREEAIWPHLARVDGRHSIESVLSGPGLVRLDAAVRLQAGGCALHGDGGAVHAAALAGDRAAGEAVVLFGLLLARVAGDLALACKATGGVFIAGGVAPRLLPLWDRAAMREAFSDKAPMGALMQTMPFALITGDQPAERGLATVARDPAAFGLEGRLWR
jgi:glucokinase